MSIRKVPAWVWAGLFVLAGLAAFFPRVFTHGEVLGPADLAFCYRPFSSSNVDGVRAGAYTLSDQFDQLIPEVQYLLGQIRQGKLPTWSDKVQNGTPLYWVIRNEAKNLPLLLIGIFFAFPVAWTIYQISRVVLGGIFFFKLLRSWGVGRRAAYFGLVPFCFSSYLVQNFGIPMALQYSLVPVCLWAVDAVLLRRSLLWGALLPILMFQMVVSGYIRPRLLTFCS